MDLRSFTRTELGVWAAFVAILVVHLLSFLPFIHVRRTGVLVPVMVFPMFTFVLAVVRVTASHEQLNALIQAGPRWLRRGFYLSGAYALVTFMIYTSNYHGQAKVTPSGFVLTDHGRVLMTISESEYWRVARGEVTFSFGFLLAFAYWGAAAYTLASRHIAAERTATDPAQLDAAGRTPALPAPGGSVMIAGFVTMAIGVAIVAVIAIAGAVIMAR